jgi:Mg-chelatase subunit ChlD
VRGLGTSDPLTTLLVIDVSGSMARAGKLEAAKAAASAYVNQMRPGDRAGLLAFATQSDV